MKNSENQPFYFNSNFSNFELFQENGYRWNLDFRKINKGGFDGSIEMLDLGKVQLARTKLNGTIVQNGFSPEGFRTFVLFADNAQSLLWMNKKVESNTMLVYREDNFWESISYDNFKVFTIAIENEHLRSIISENNFEDLEKNERILSLDPATLHTLQQFLNTLFFKLNHNALVMHSPNLKNKVLFKLPHLLFQILNDGTHKQDKHHLRKRDVAINKAIRYIQETDYSKITIPEICSFSEVSERTLEYGFQERFLVSPKQYVKAIKIGEVRNEILKVKNGFTISEIAKKHGFNHMGQFSADYKQFFGELPSATALEAKNKNK